jgi:hypothetical protein
MKLPRELRNRVYDFHLASVYERARTLDTSFYSIYHEPKPTRDEWHFVGERKVYEAFYQPVFHKETPPVSSMEFSFTSFKPYEHHLPPLMLLDGTQIAKEAREYYIRMKLLVDVDSINRFQIWYLALPAQKRRSIQKLHIVTRMSFASAETGRHIYHSGELADHPAFMIRICNNGEDLIVSSRFPLAPDHLAILQANIDTLLKDRLTSKAKFDGDDVVETMFAFHNRVIRPARIDLVIGAMRKGVLEWNFMMGPEDAAKIEGNPDASEEVFDDIVGREVVSKHILYRARIVRAEVIA